jgi:hypothetical protein
VNYFVLYAEAKYEGERLEVLPFNKSKLEAFLNERAGNPDFTFRVIQGQEITVEAVEVVKQFRVK